MSKDYNLIAETGVSSRKATINVIHEIDEEHFEEPEIAGRNAISVGS